MYARSRGSHRVCIHPATGRRTTVAYHAGDEVPKGTLQDNLKDIGLSWEEFERLLKTLAEFALLSAGVAR